VKSQTRKAETHDGRIEGVKLGACILHGKDAWLELPGADRKENWVLMIVDQRRVKQVIVPGDSEAAQQVTSEEPEAV
jgi:hypothetical protein